MSAYFAWTRRAGKATLFAWLALYAAGCGLEAEPDMPGAAGSAGSGGGGTAGTAGTQAPAITLQILDSQMMLYTPRENDTVIRAPRELTAVSVFVSDGARQVRFALLPSDPAATSEDMLPGDAALDDTEIWTDEAGEGMVTLSAPSRPTTFLLRASIGTLASRQIRFAVEGDGSASLEAVPLYDGRRNVERWTAEAIPGRTCAELDADSLPTSGVKTNSATGDSVVIEDVPAGGPLAVSLRAEHFAWGCADVENLVENADPQRVEVVVTDVQVQLDESRVELELGLDSLDAWTELLELPLPDVVTALRGGAEDDVEALLDAMQQELGDDDTAFASKRGSDKWDTRVREALGERATNVLSEPFADWLAAGLADLDGERALRGVLAPYGEAAGSAELTLKSVFGHDAKRAGFTVENRGSWSAVADVVLIGMTLDFNPHALLVTAAEDSAVADSEDATSTAEALAERLSCRLVADTIAAADPCGGDCESLCVDGLERLVADSAKAPRDLAELAIAASGAAGVGAHAELDNLDGSWIGRLGYGSLELDVGGNASARGD